VLKDDCRHSQTGQLSPASAGLAEIRRRLTARRSTDLPVRLLASVAPLFRDLERDAEAVLSGWKV